MPDQSQADSGPNWFQLKFKGQDHIALAEKVQHTLAQVGIAIEIQHARYVAAVMFGDGLDELNCGYCRHPAGRHTWGIAGQPDGSFDVDHFNCNQCANDRDTSLVVCYTRPGGGALRDGY